MGQQSNKIQKRRRRKSYLERKKAKLPVKAKPKAKTAPKKAAASPPSTAA